jgi:DNA-binding PadR family transcriptional regulator
MTDAGGRTTTVGAIATGTSLVRKGLVSSTEPGDGTRVRYELTERGRLAVIELRKLADTGAGGLNFTQHSIDRADLVVLVGHDGLVQWSSHRDREQCARMLEGIAEGIRRGTL